MSGQCRMPGKPCERLATVRVRVVMVGERDLCWHCWQALSSLGMDIRRIDEVAARPEWDVPLVVA